LDASGSRSETPGKFETWCWRRMKKISWTDHVRNEEVLLIVKEHRNRKWCWRRMEKIIWTDRVRNELLLRVKGERNILYEIVNGRLTGLVTFCVETAFYDRLLKER
jgi:hypothetical protein